MANIFKALYYTLEFEGGFSNDPIDHGGATNYGITQATLNNYLKKYPSAKVPDRVDKLSIKDVEEIYKDGYWKFDGIEDQRVATKIFDMSVNFGLGSAVKLVQKIVKTDPDGSWGPLTQAKVNAQTPLPFLDELVTACIHRYEAIMEKDPTQEKYRKGWLKRARSKPEEV